MMTSPKHAPVYSLLYLFLGAFCSVAVADGKTDSRTPLIGTWRCNKPPLLYNVSRDSDGAVVAEYGYQGQERPVGHWAGQFDGKFFKGTWKGAGADGDLILEQVNPNLALVTWWKGASRPNGFDGRYYLHKQSNTPGSLIDQAREAHAWRYEVVEKYTNDAARKQLTDRQWLEEAGKLRAEIEQANRWDKAWWLPAKIRQTPMSEWSAGHVENLFIDLARAANQRDKHVPESRVTHFRFDDAAAQPLAGTTRYLSSYQQSNQESLRQFNRLVHGQAQLKGAERIRLYYAAWDYLTENESHRVIARPSGHGQEPLAVMLYNDSHRTIQGKYRVDICDAERVIATGTGSAEIAPYAETKVPVQTVAAPYVFTYMRVKLQFTPHDYDRRPIPKETIQPFHKTVEQYAALSQAEDPRLDFLEAMLWARVEQAWEANDLKRYARAVRDAGGWLYYRAEGSPAVKAYVREFLEPLERAADLRETPAPEDLMTGVADLKVPLYVADTNIRERAVTGERVRDQAGWIALSRAKRYDPALMPKSALTVTKEIQAAIMHGRFVLSKSGASVGTSGHIELFDGPVSIGSYPLDAYFDYGESELQFAPAARTVSFYDGEPSYRLQLAFHRWADPPRGQMERFNLMQKLNSISPGLQRVELP